MWRGAMQGGVGRCREVWGDVMWRGATQGGEGRCTVARGDAGWREAVQTLMLPESKLPIGGGAEGGGGGVMVLPCVGGC